MEAVAALPEGLAAMPPGPGLAAVLGAVELSVVPNDRMLEVLAAQHRQLCHEQARMVAVLAELGRCAGSVPAGGVARREVMDRYAPDETRAALRWTRGAADFEHDVAETVVHVMPGLFEAWLSGVLDRPRVLVFHRYLADLDPVQVGAICAVAVPRASGLTTGQLAVLLRRMVLAVDPAAAERWYRKGVRERNVVAVMGPDGTVTMSGNGLPADEAEAACVRLQDLADAAQRAGHPGLLGQIRCDLFLGMLDGRFQGMGTAQILATLITQFRPDGRVTAEDSSTAVVAGPVADPVAGSVAGSATTGSGGDGRNRSGSAAGSVAAGSAAAGPAAAGSAAAGPTAAGSAAAGPIGTGQAGTGSAGRSGSCDSRVGIEIRVALSTLLGLDEHPGEIPGLGLLGAAATRARVALQRRAQWRFAVTDPAGRLISEGITRRRPDTVAGYPVHRDGPVGGIVEIHIPVVFLDGLVAGGAAAQGEWVGVVADIAAQHGRRDEHLADLDAHPARRFPTAALRRHTEVRDRTCVFPGCRRRARASQVDHTREHARGGETVTANTAPACGHDHDVKHGGGWCLVQSEPGRFVWHSPLGGRYRTGGEFLLPDLPDPHPVDLGAYFDRPTRTVEGPILQPYRPVRPPRPPPPRSDLPDDPPF